MFLSRKKSVPFAVKRSDLMFVIALKMLLGDKIKYITMVAGICFASTIMTQQPSILVGLLSRTYSFVKDTPGPDIWVMDPGVKFVEENKHFRAMNLNIIKGIEGIEWAAPLFKSMVRAKLPDGTTVGIDMTGLDDSTLVGAPIATQSPLSYLKKADAIFVEETAANTNLKVTNEDGTHRPLGVGDVIEINDKRAIVAGLYKGTRNFILQPQIITLYSRAHSYSMPTRMTMTYALVKTKNGYQDANIIQKIEEKTGLKALTTSDFCKLNLAYWRDNTGIPINFGISVFLGFLVGAAVVSQTFFNFVHENAKYYASLQAMGIATKTLVLMVIFQALFVGFVGYGLGLISTVIFGIIVNDSVLAFRFSPHILVLSFLGVFLIIALSAMLSINKIIKIDPSIVFRS